MDERAPVVRASASGDAQQAVLGQGVQTNYFYAAPEQPAVAHTLVPPPTTMVGRQPELDRLRAACAGTVSGDSPVTVCLVEGPGGVGKTALTRALAVEVVQHFPDGRIEVDLFGYTPGRPPREVGEVLGEVLNLVGARDVPPGSEARAQAWRSWLAGRRVLLLLDNARDVEQVRPLLPAAAAGAAGRCLVLVTGRTRMPGLDHGVLLALGTMPMADAVALLLRVGGRQPGELPDQDVEALATLCARLPLALRAVGPLLNRLDAAELLAVMNSTRRPLEYLTEADRAASAAFSVSYEALRPPLRDTLRVCAWHPGPDLDAASLAALADRPVGLVTVQLVELLQANMLTGLPGGRYAAFDLFLDYARQLVEQHDDPAAVAAGRYRLYAQLEARLAAATALIYVDNRYVVAGDPGHVGFPDVASATQWLARAVDEVTSVAHAALAENWPGSARLGLAAAYWMHAEGRSDKAAALYRDLVEWAVQAGDLAAEAAALEGTGLVAWAQSDLELAGESYRAAQERYEQTGLPLARASSLKGLGDVHRSLEEHEAALDAYRQAGELFDAAGDARGRVDALTGLGDSTFALARLEPAAEAFEQARGLARSLGYRSGHADALCGLGDVAQARGDLAAAAEAYRQARQIYQDIANRHGLAYAVKGQAEVAYATGHPDAAELYGTALDMYERIGFRHYQVQIKQRLAELSQDSSGRSPCGPPAG